MEPLWTGLSAQVTWSRSGQACLHKSAQRPHHTASLTNPHPGPGSLAVEGPCFCQLSVPAAQPLLNSTQGPHYLIWPLATFLSLQTSVPISILTLDSILPAWQKYHHKNQDLCPKTFIPASFIKVEE